MYLHEAIKAAGEGRKIRRESDGAEIILDNSSKFVRISGSLASDDPNLNFLMFNEVTANDWEVVKEKKIAVIEKCKWSHSGDNAGTGIVYPTGEISGDSSYSNLVGKTTKVTIEWEE